MAKNPRKTGPVAASDAARVLNDPKATDDERAAAASALSQVVGGRQTGSVAASDAGRVLNAPKATDDERAAAASALSQAQFGPGKGKNKKK